MTSMRTSGSIWIMIKARKVLKKEAKKDAAFHTLSFQGKKGDEEEGRHEADKEEGSHAAPKINNDGHEGLAKVSSTNWCKCWAIQVDEGRPAGCDDTGHVGHDKVLYWQGLMILGDFGEPPSAIIDLQ